MAQLARRHHPPEVIDITQNGCTGPAAARMGVSSSSGSARGSGSSGNSPQAVHIKDRWSLRLRRPQHRLLLQDAR